MIRIGTHKSGFAQIFEPNKDVAKRGYSVYLFFANWPFFPLSWQVF
jgi:hypothetical protein